VNVGWVTGTSNRTRFSGGLPSENLPQPGSESSPKCDRL